MVVHTRDLPARPTSGQIKDWQLPLAGKLNEAPGAGSGKYTPCVSERGGAAILVAANCRIWKLSYGCRRGVETCGSKWAGAGARRRPSIKREKFSLDRWPTRIFRQAVRRRQELPTRYRQTRGFGNPAFRRLASWSW